MMVTGTATLSSVLCVYILLYTQVMRLNVSNDNYLQEETNILGSNNDN